jgi:hypothetical protein
MIVFLGRLPSVGRRVVCDTVSPGSYVSPPQLWRIAAFKCNRIAHARDWTVQRKLHHEKFRNGVLVSPLKVTAKIDEWQRLTYEPGGKLKADVVL